MDLTQFIASKSYNSFKKSFTKSIIRLSIAATTLSLAVMIVSQSIFNGFQKEIAKKVFGFWGHIHITDIASNRSIEPITIHLNDSLKEAIKNSGNLIHQPDLVRHIQSFLIYPSIIGGVENNEGVFIKGVGEDFDWSFFKHFLVSGNTIELPDSGFARSIMIAEETANRLNTSVGKSIILNFFVNDELIKRKVTVGGIYNTGLAEYDRKFAIVDINLIRNVLKKEKDEVSGIEVFCDDVLHAVTANNLLYENVLPSNWYSETIRDRFPNIFEWLSLQDLNKVFILSLILAVCIINMSTTLMILILERTHMIGVLTVLGMSKWRQRKIFLYYATRILLYSLLLGNIIGMGLCYLQDHFKLIKLSESDYYLSYAPVDLQWGPVLLLNFGVFILILICLILPSWLVNSIKPVSALKFR